MTGKPLSAAEVEAYRRDGLVVPAWRVPGDLLAEMRAALDRLLAANPQADRNLMICPHLTGYGPGALDGEELWLDWARNSDFLDMIEQMISPDILLWGTTIFGKPAGTGQVIPWHQDAPHWPISPPATTSIWIALDDCTPENGCLRYIPGSHLGAVGHIDINATAAGEAAAVRLILDPDGIDESRARDVVLESGQISIHDAWLVHGSTPNLSTQRRAAFVLRYMPAAHRFEHAGGNAAARRAGAVTDYESRPLYLLRGRNTGRSDLSIGHPA